MSYGRYFCLFHSRKLKLFFTPRTWEASSRRKAMVRHSQREKRVSWGGQIQQRQEALKRERLWASSQRETFHCICHILILRNEENAKTILRVRLLSHPMFDASFWTTIALGNRIWMSSFFVHSTGKAVMKPFISERCWPLRCVVVRSRNFFGRA